MDNTYDVIISGGGLVGLSMAVALAQAHMQVCVIEQGDMPAQLEPQFDGRTCAVSLGSKRILDSIGAWQPMAAHAEPITDIRISEGHSPFFLHYSHEEIRDEMNGEPFGYIVENRYIRHALHSVAATLPGLAIRDRCAIAAYMPHESHVEVTIRSIKSGEMQTLRARLLIGAEGKNSPLREMAGIRSTGWSYHETAIVCTIAHEKPHGGLAQERFLPAGPFAVLPMTHSRSSLVWVEPDDRVSMYMELPKEEMEQEISERVGGYLGKIELAGKCFSYPLALVHANRYISQRLALIGDSAHGMHPIAGQGVNLGFRDVAVLCELLEEKFALGLDIGAEEVLEHYQRWRRLDNVSMLGVTDGLNRLFALRQGPMRLARGLGMMGVQMLPPLKRFLMRHAMGLAGDLPKMAAKN